MTKYEKAISLNKEEFISWLACMMALVAVGEDDFNMFALARDRYKVWLRDNWADREVVSKK